MGEPCALNSASALPCDSPTIFQVTGSLASGLAAALGEPKFGQLVAALGATRFYSITYRLFKLPAGRLEAAAEDYGQAARYKVRCYCGQLQRLWQDRSFLSSDYRGRVGGATR